MLYIILIIVIRIMITTLDSCSLPNSQNPQCVMPLQIRIVYSDWFETRFFVCQWPVIVITEALCGEQLVATGGTTSASTDNDMVDRINDALVCHSHRAQPSAADMNAATIDSLVPKFHAWYKDQVFHTKLEKPLGQADDNENVITDLVTKHQTFQKIWLQYQDQYSCGESGNLSSMHISESKAPFALHVGDLL